MPEYIDTNQENIVRELSDLVNKLRAMGRHDLLLDAIGVPVLEELRLEAAKRKLSRLKITKDYNFILVDYGNREIDLQPVHKAVYLFFSPIPRASSSSGLPSIAVSCCDTIWPLQKA